MQIPKRKSGRYTTMPFDPHMTQIKLDALRRELDTLKRVRQPAAIAETKRLGELGDFSENAEYQLAKGRLRGINARIDELEYMIRSAVVIARAEDGHVQIGSRVAVAIDGEQKIFTILGSSESDPGHGIISHTSPIGSALLGRLQGDTFILTIGSRQSHCQIIHVD